MSNARKRNMVIVLSIVLVAALIIGFTYSYFTDEGEVVNTFTMGDLEIKLEETWDPEDGEEMVPGRTVVKEPIVTAEKGDSYMRVIVSIVDKETEAPVTDTARLNKILSTLFYDPLNKLDAATPAKYSLAQLANLLADSTSRVESWYNTGAFEIQTTATPGVYVLYYKVGTSYVFPEGATATLFSKVVIPTDWNQDDLKVLGSYDIVIRAEAIQVEGFANVTEAFQALDDYIASQP